MAERNRGGQTTLEFALAFAGVLLPVTFAVVFTSQLLWVWHSVNDFTRQGASYATTHCWQSAAGNVLDFMRSNVPPMIGQEQFQNGPAQISVTYYSRDPASGQLTPFSCDGECSSDCIPDTVQVSVTGFEYRTFVTSLGFRPCPFAIFRPRCPWKAPAAIPSKELACRRMKDLPCPSRY